MPRDWVMLHGGALGDLALALQLALRLPGMGQSGAFLLISRTNPGDLSAGQPPVQRRSSEALGLHWLHATGSGRAEGARPPVELHRLCGGRNVLNMLAGPDSSVHVRLVEFGAAAVYSIDPRPRPNVGRHITEQWQTALEAQGLLIPKCIHQRPARRGIALPEPVRKRGRELLQAAGSGRPPVLIHAGSGGRSKTWPLPNFIELAGEVRRRRLDVCFIVGPVEVEWWSEATIAALRETFPVLMLPPPDDLLAALAASRCLIANDSGPAHLAGLIGTPIVAIFGPTSPDVWRPLGPSVHVIAGRPEPDATSWGLIPADISNMIVELNGAGAADSLP